MKHPTQMHHDDLERINDAASARQACPSASQQRSGGRDPVKQHRRVLIERLRHQIAALCGPMDEPTVSNHALVRYLEITRGLDLAAIKREMLSERTAAAVRVLGTGTIRKSGLSLVFKDRGIVTVLGAEAHR